VELAVEAPGDRLPDRPAASPFSIQAERARKVVEASHDLLVAVAELGRADDRRETELPLADERLRVDYEPRLALGGQDVVGVEVLVHEDLLALGVGQLLERAHRFLEDRRFERSPVPLPRLGQVADPPFGLLAERAEGTTGRLPEPWQEACQDLERAVGGLDPQVRPWPAALKKEGVAFVVSREESHRSVAVPQLERIGLVLALPVRPLDLQNDVARGNDVRRIAPGERLLEPEIPLRCALLDEPRKLLFPSGSV